MLATLRRSWLLICFATAPAWSEDLVQFSIQSPDQSATRSYSSIVSAVDAFSTTSRLQGLLPGYTETTPVSGTFKVLGQQINASYAAGSSDLTISIPGCGLNRTYQGGNRRQNGEKFARQPDSRACLDDLAPLGQFAGGPGSAQSRTAADDFNAALEDAGSGVGLSARFGSFSAGGANSKDVLLPLDYTWRLSARDSLQVDVPVSYTDVDGGRSYSAGAGLRWRHRLTPNWTVQSSVHLGAVGSPELATGAAYWGVGVNSVATFDLPHQLQFTLANGLTYIATIPLSISGYSLDDKVSNVVFRNGVLLSRGLDMRLFNLPLRGSVFAVDTRYAGSAVGISNYQEFGFVIAVGSVAPARIGATYFTGARGLSGFTVNTGVRF